MVYWTAAVVSKGSGLRGEDMSGSIGDLDSNTIRRLILKTKASNGQIGDIGRNVLYMAKTEGLLSTVPDLAYEHPLAQKITAVIWELIIEGIYTPGTGMQHPNLPFLRSTEYGRKCFEAGELTAHDPDDYLRRLKAACPGRRRCRLQFQLGTNDAADCPATNPRIGVLGLLADRQSKGRGRVQPFGPQGSFEVGRVCTMPVLHPRSAT